MTDEKRRSRTASPRAGALLRVAAACLGVALCGLLLAACGGSSKSSSSTAASGGSGSSEGSGRGQTLNVLSWETYDEPEWIKEFEHESGIKVNVSNVGSPAEMFSKVKANPSQYDIILATAGWFPQYVKAGLLEPIDKSKIANIKNIKLGFPWEDATSVEGKLYGVLYNWGDQPLAWIPEGVKGLNLSKYENSKGELNNWNVLWDPALKGKVSMFDDPTSVEPMIPLALGFKNPYKLDSQEFSAFEKKLAELRPQIKRLTSGFNDQTTQLASGEATVAYLNNVASATALKKEGKKLIVNNTVEQGVPAWSDNLSITKQGGAKKLAAVYKFMDASLTPKWQARFIAKSGNSGTLNYEQATSSEAKAVGLTSAALEGTLIPATKAGQAFFSKMNFFQPVENLEKRLKVWNEFKLGIGG
jgi:spermidine/putrescine-binding protein